MNMNELPVMPMACYGKSEQDGVVYGAADHESGNSTQIRIAGIARIGAEYILECRIVVSSMRDFCGGIIVTSAEINVHEEAAWGDQGINRSNRERGVDLVDCVFKLPNLIEDERFPRDMGAENVRRYGEHCLAMAIVNYAAYTSRSLIMAADRAGGNVEAVVNRAAALTYLRPCLAHLQALRTNPADRRMGKVVGAQSLIPMEGALNTTDGFNVNSDNEVVSMTLEVCIDEFLGSGCDDDREYRDYDELLTAGWETEDAHSLQDMWWNGREETCTSRFLQRTFWYCG